MEVGNNYEKKVSKLSVYKRIKCLGTNESQNVLDQSGFWIQISR